MRKSCRLDNRDVKDISALKRDDGMENASEGSHLVFWTIKNKGGGIFLILQDSINVTFQ